jgi:type II secretory pathway predicted ATPase ExeA
MYYQHFGLDRPPFKITPDTDFFFSGGNRGAVLEALLYAVTQGEGIVKVTGEVGSGKTMLCRMLQSRLPGEIEQVYLANPSVSPEEILRAIAFELGLPIPREASRIEVMHALHDHLVKRHAEGRQVVVFVEESQSMPVATLEEIRLLSNLETRHHKLLQIVLFGQPELDAILAEPGMRQLRERIAHSFSLQPLRSAEVSEYLAFRLRAAGYRGPDLFAPKLVRYIADATGGLSRRVNLVADKALLAAFADNTHTVKLAHVQAAVRDSEFSAKASPQARRWMGSVALLLAGAAIGVGAYWWLQGGPAPASRTPTAGDASTAVPVREAPSPVTESAPAPAAPSARTAPATPPKGGDGLAAPDTAADTVTARLAATDRWLEKIGEHGFTIQLTLVSDDPDELRRYLNHVGKFIETDEVFVYRTRVKETPYFGVAYGAFSTRQAARAALNKLPESIRSSRPYVRSQAGIRREAKRSP